MESIATLCGVMGKHPKNLSRLIAGKHVSIIHHSASTAFAQAELSLAACAHGPRRISGGQYCPESGLGSRSAQARPMFVRTLSRIARKSARSEELSGGTECVRTGRT